MNLPFSSLLGVVYSGEQTGRPNLEVWKGEEKVAEFVQKKTQSWYASDKKKKTPVATLTFVFTHSL